MKTSHFALSVLAVSLVIGMGCSKSTDRAPAMRPASGVQADPATKPSTLNGINEISEARCDREVRCGGVGPDEDYGTRDQCIFELNSAGYDDLDAEACPKGLDQNELGKCLSEIAAERCGAPLDTLERLVACRSATLCKD
jgi:hypothetical protein